MFNWYPIPKDIDRVDAVWKDAKENKQGGEFKNGAFNGVNYQIADHYVRYGYKKNGEVWGKQRTVYSSKYITKTCDYTEHKSDGDLSSSFGLLRMRRGNIVVFS